MPKKKKTKLEGAHLAKMFGKHSYLQVLWNDWKTKLPKSDEEIFIIIKLTKGYYVVQGTYYEQAIPYGCDREGNMVIPPRIFKFVRFDNHQFPDTHLGTKDGKRLIAWGVLEKYAP